MFMIEVFKTNVLHRDHANLLVAKIHERFGDYTANFDLDDCDRILRVKCTGDRIRPSVVIELLKNFGFDAEVLPDENEVLMSAALTTGPGVL
jgi:hypothetical protein